MISTSAGPTRQGFSAVEMLVVISVMVLLIGMAVPTVVSSVRQTAVRQASRGVLEIWRQARLLALQHQPPPKVAGESGVRHFGVLIVQRGDDLSAHLIYDFRASHALSDVNTAVMRRPIWDSGTEQFNYSDSSREAVRSLRFSRNVAMSVVQPGRSYPVDLISGDRTLTVYAQYRTGMPIHAMDVQNDAALAAVPDGLGVNGSRVAERVVFSTVNFNPETKTGYGMTCAIFHAGVGATEDL